MDQLVHEALRQLVEDARRVCAAPPPPQCALELRAARAIYAECGAPMTDAG